LILDYTPPTECLNQKILVRLKPFQSVSGVEDRVSDELGSGTSDTRAVAAEVILSWDDEETAIPVLLSEHHYLAFEQYPTETVESDLEYVAANSSNYYHRIRAARALMALEDVSTVETVAGNVLTLAQIVSPDFDTIRAKFESMVLLQALDVNMANHLTNLTKHAADTSSLVSKHCVRTIGTLHINGSGAATSALQGLQSSGSSLAIRRMAEWYLQNY